MKPLYLEIQAFGPYADRQTVDFENLAEKGMYIIKGETGSGKTTIFDAMTFALYGGASGEKESRRAVGRNSLEEWRCTQADPGTDTYVSFTFSVHGHKYKFTRRLKKSTVTPRYECSEIDEDGNCIPLFENPKADDLTSKAAELIGLSKEQFRQVVLLPQGQFEKFLVASSDSKEEILKKIFGSGQWSVYAENFKQIALKRKKELEDEETLISNSLAEEGLAGTDELAAKIESLREESESSKAGHAEFDGEKKQKELNLDIELSAKFRPLHDLESRKTALENQKPETDAKRISYENAEKAEKVRGPIEEFDKAESESDKRTAEYGKLRKKIPDAESKKQTAAGKRDEAEKNSPVDGLNKEIGTYESKIPVYETVDKLKTAYSESAAACTDAETSLKNAENRLTAATEKARKAKDSFDNAENTAKDYRDRYYSGIYGEIASELEEEKPCPVCGSIHHPSPAKKAPDSVSKADMDAKEKASKTAKNAWDTAESERTAAEKARDEKKLDYDEKHTAATKAEADYNAALKNLIENIADTAALKKAITDAKDKIAAYEANLVKLRQEYQTASDELTTLNQQITNAEKEMNDASAKLAGAKNNLESALKGNGFESRDAVKAMLMSSDDRTALHKEIVEYDNSLKQVTADLESKTKELSGKTEPDSSKFEERQNEITAESKEFSETISRLKSENERLEKKLDMLLKKEKHYKENIAEAEEDLAFAKKLRGETGVGIQRYILAVMFNQVIAEANRMLTKVHGGRYYLFRSDDGEKGNKRGLSLKVHDNRSPQSEGRNVDMLSGGEKFLVSLALSIGMSTVAQKSGIRIEALFIDEGFGTLDDKSISDAIDVLDSVRKGSGSIGIISHVQLLEANIPTHLEVVKTEKGSSIRMG